MSAIVVLPSFQQHRYQPVSFSHNDRMPSVWARVAAELSRCSISTSLHRFRNAQNVAIRVRFIIKLNIERGALSIIRHFGIVCSNWENMPKQITHTQFFFVPHFRWLSWIVEIIIYVHFPHFAVSSTFVYSFDFFFVFIATEFFFFFFGSVLFLDVALYRSFSLSHTHTLVRRVDVTHSLTIAVFISKQMWQRAYAQNLMGIFCFGFFISTEYICPKTIGKWFISPFLQ